MTRLPSLDAPTHWLDGLPEREIYDIYADTLAKRFPAFHVRGFDEARIDLAQTLHLSLIHISEPTRLLVQSRMPSCA